MGMAGDKMDRPSPGYSTRALRRGIPETRPSGPTPYPVHISMHTTCLCPGRLLAIYSPRAIGSTPCF